MLEKFTNSHDNKDDGPGCESLIYILKNITIKSVLNLSIGNFHFK